MPMKIVDFHSHILPAIDDGSRSIEESLALLKEEKSQGIDVVVATPHFYPQHDTPEKFLARRDAAYRNLLKEISKDDNLPQIIQGAEVYYFKGIGQWEGLKKLAIEGTDYILIEMPMGKWTDRMYDDIYDIYRSQGLIPIIAHLDRYINIFNVKGIVSKLEELNVIIQANASFFNKKSTRKLALKLIKKSVINIIGSDCHNMTTRKPNIKQAVDAIVQQLGEEYIKNINNTEEKILHNIITVNI